MQIFGQVWLYSLGAFVIGALLAWLLLVPPLRKRNRELTRQLSRERASRAAAEAQAPARATRPGTLAAVTAAAEAQTPPPPAAQSGGEEDEFVWADEQASREAAYPGSYDSYDEPYRNAPFGSTEATTVQPPVPQQYGGGQFDAQPYENQPYENQPYDEQPYPAQQDARQTGNFGLPDASSDATTLFAGDIDQGDEPVRDFFEEAPTAGAWRPGALDPQEPAPGDGDRTEADEAYLAYLDETHGRADGEEDVASARGELRLSESPAERTTVLPPTPAAPAEPEPQQQDFFADAFSTDPYTADSHAADSYAADSHTADSYAADSFTADSFTAYQPAEEPASEPLPRREPRSNRGDAFAPLDSAPLRPDEQPEERTNFFQPAHAFRAPDSSLADQRPAGDEQSPESAPRGAFDPPTGSYGGQGFDAFSSAPVDDETPAEQTRVFAPADAPAPAGFQEQPGLHEQPAFQEPAGFAGPAGGPEPTGFMEPVGQPEPPPPPPSDVPPGPFGPGSALPQPDGSAPTAEFQVKARTSSMVFHTPSSPFFDRLLPQVWFRTPEDAMRAGFTSWQRPEGSWGN